MQIEAAARTTPRILMVGFNRRFSRHARAIRDAFNGCGPLMMQYRVNAGSLTPGHWVNDPVVGGGRVIGEAGHFVDLMSYLTCDAGILSIQGGSPSRSSATADDASVLLSFADGSVGQLLYTAHGSPKAGKERLEVHAHGTTAILEDFRRCTVMKNGTLTKLRGLDKGHRDEIRAFMEAVRGGSAAPIGARRLIRFAPLQLGPALLLLRLRL